jgi:copper chaperone
MKKAKIKINGMHCPSCEMLIKDSLDDVGVKAEVSHKSNSANVEFDEKKISIDKIKSIIKENGYTTE